MRTSQAGIVDKEISKNASATVDCATSIVNCNAFVTVRHQVAAWRTTCPAAIPKESHSAGIAGLVGIASVTVWNNLTAGKASVSDQEGPHSTKRACDIKAQGVCCALSTIWNGVGTKVTCVSIILGIESNSAGGASPI